MTPPGGRGRGFFGIVDAGKEGGPRPDNRIFERSEAMGRDEGQRSDRPRCRKLELTTREFCNGHQRGAGRSRTRGGAVLLRGPPTPFRGIGQIHLLFLRSWDRVSMCAATTITMRLLMCHKLTAASCLVHVHLQTVFLLLGR